MENIEVKVESGVKTLEIREGDALPLHEPIKVRIDGVIDTPFKWLEKRVAEINQKTSHIIVNRDKMVLLSSSTRRTTIARRSPGNWNITPISSHLVSIKATISPRFRWQNLSK